MIFIPNNVPSLKNSKIISMINNRPVLVHSKTVRKYLQKMGIKKYNGSKKIVLEYVSANRPNLFKQALKGAKIESKYIGFHFARDSKRKFDFHNAVQIVADLLVAHDFIEDDNMDYFIPYNFKREGLDYTYDKANAGVYLEINMP